MGLSVTEVGPRLCAAALVLLSPVQQVKAGVVADVRLARLVARAAHASHGNQRLVLWLPQGGSRTRGRRWAGDVAAVVVFKKPQCGGRAGRRQWGAR